MKKLGKNWLTEKHIDQEYKRYVLLAYLKEVEKRFGANRLYPHYAELQEHYRNLTAIKRQIDELSGLFPAEPVELDLESFRFVYEKMIADDRVMEELLEVIKYSIPKFKHYLGEGKKIKNIVEEHMHIESVGLVPLNGSEGYMFLRSGSNTTHLYFYTITLFDKPESDHKRIHTRYIGSYPLGISRTYQSIKGELIHDNRMIPNPATYCVETDMTLPIRDTFLPIAARALARYIS